MARSAPKAGAVCGPRRVESFLAQAAICASPPTKSQENNMDHLINMLVEYGLYLGIPLTYQEVIAWN
jgi:hypothetical protein